MNFSMMIRRSGARGFIPKAEITGERLAALLPLPACAALSGLLAAGAPVGPTRPLSACS